MWDLERDLLLVQLWVLELVPHWDQESDLVWDLVWGLHLVLG